MTVDDVRWFAPNRYCALPVPALRRAGLRIALEGEGPARLAVAMDVPCAVIAHEYALRHGCPLVLNIADLPPWRLGEGRPDIVFVAGGRIRRVPRLLHRYPERPGYYSRIRYVARRAAEVWSPSAHSAASVTSRFGIPARRVPFCYDSDRFTPGPPPVPGAAVTLLSVSRLVPHKNHALALRVAARLVPRPAVRIIGQGPEGSRLRALAAELGVDLRLEEGWASDEAVLAAYRDAGVVLCPSRFEGFGLTPMEGLATGRPVIASDIPPHREFVGGLVPLLDPDDLEGWVRAAGAALESASPPRPTRPPALDDLTIDACAARLFLHLRRLLGDPA